MNQPQRLMIIFLLLVTAIGFYIPRHQPPVAHNLIRLHVIANSNYFYDQELKGRVKDRIISATAPEFNKAQNIAQARAMTGELAHRIEQVAREEIKRQGFDYPVQVVRGNFTFPAKTYTIQNRTLGEGSCTLPAGRYEAVRVIIGEGRGNNWWCVLYPPLCFVSPGSALPPLVTPVANAGQEKTDQAPGAISTTTPDHKKNTPRIQYRFKIVELFKSWGRPR